MTTMLARRPPAFRSAAPQAAPAMLAPEAAS